MRVLLVFLEVRLERVAVAIMKVELISQFGVHFATPLWVELFLGLPRGDALELGGLFSFIPLGRLLRFTLVLSFALSWRGKGGA